jgi:predicted AlkP superfamily pyrophosphatase or phosphodiesterase
MRSLLFFLWMAPLWAQAPLVKHVVVIGVDGLSPDGLRKAKVPNVEAMRAAGAWTYHGRGVMPTVSAPNWASMIMGAGPEQHGITSNEWKLDQYDFTPTVKGPSGIFPTIFFLLRGQRKDATIGVFHHWDEFSRLVEPGVPSVIEHYKTAQETMDRAVAYFQATKPTLLFIHLDLVDDAGHEYGHGTPQYITSVEEADRLAGLVLQATKTAGIEKDTLVLLTADHGGVGKKHGGNTMAELEIPWVVQGPGVRRGHEVKAPVNTFDTAATIAYVLGLKQPYAWIGRPVSEAFTR